MDVGSIVLMVITGIVLTLAVLLVVLLRLVYNRALIKRTLDGQVLLAEVLPAVARRTETERLAEGEQQILQVAMQRLLPEGWASTQSSQAIDSVYAFVGNKEQPYPELAIDLDPLLTALSSREGRDAIGAYVDQLPNCPGMTRQPPPGLFGLPACVPVGMRRGQMIRQMQKQLDKELSRRLRPVTVNGVLPFEGIEQIVPTRPGEERPNVRKGFTELRDSLVQMRRLAWILAAVIVVGLGAALFFAQPLTPAIVATVLGWPLAGAGLAVLIISLIIMWRVNRQLLGPTQPAAVRAWLAEPLRVWREHLWLGGGTLLAIGVILLIVGNTL